MYTDLFRALVNKENPSRHPLLAALLYNFCPAAAKWWLAGAVPVIPFDPVWEALTDFPTGRSLEQMVKEKGFETLWEDSKTYLRSINDFRNSHKNSHAPELSSIFTGKGVSQAERFGLQEAFEKFGGDWRNYYRYLHARTFLIRDWLTNTKMDSQVKTRLKKTELRFTLGFVRKSIQWEAWAFHAKTGGVQRLLLGLLHPRGKDLDVMRFFLAQHAVPENGLWPAQPEIIGLERSGLVTRYQAPISDEQMEKIIEKHIQLAEQGPHPAFHALRQPSICRYCGFKAQCFTSDNQLTPLVSKTFERIIP
jgi:hypothetical protein